MLGTATDHADKLAALKRELRQIAPTALLATPTAAPPDHSDRGDRWSTGRGDLDAALEGGGLVRGALCELAGAPSSGKTSVAFGLVARAQSLGLVAFIDGRDQFFPPAAAALGVDLERLLWVRPGHRLSAVARATEILVRSRAFALIVIDTPTGSRLSRSIAQRLATSASQTSTSLLVLSDRAGAIEGARTRLHVLPANDGTDASRDATVLVHKGSASGAPEPVAISLPRRRGTARATPPVAPAIERTAPGNEPPGARPPAPDAPLLERAI